MGTVSAKALVNVDTSVSALGLGLSRVHHLRTQAPRTQLIRGALDQGVTHFDTAAFYGDGISERSLGRALRGRRSEATITSKFGLLPNRVLGAAGYAAAPAWAIRGALARSGRMDWPRRDYSVTALRASLHRSLRRLETDHIDFFMVHEPPGTVDLDKLVAELHSMKAAGKVRFVGLAGTEASRIFDTAPDAWDVCQTTLTAAAAGSVEPDFIYGALSSSEGSPTEALRRALQQTHGCLLLGTRNSAHLAEAVRIVSA